MNFPDFTALTAAAGLVAGRVLCWLLMQGRSAATRPPARAQAELAQALDRIRQLEANYHAAVKRHDDLQRQTARARDRPDLRPRDLAPELSVQLTSLQAQLSALRAQEITARADTAQTQVAVLEQENALLRPTAAALPVAAQASMARSAAAPVLEARVRALQDLEKAIRKEFQLLAELRRNVTLPSATRPEFQGSPEPRTGNAAAA